MSSATQQRDYSANLAKQQPDRALQVARGIEDPWFRCQALSHVARYLVPEAERNDVLTEAFLAGSKLSEPNRVATVSAWPLKVLALTSQSSRLEAERDRVLAECLNTCGPRAFMVGEISLIQGIRRINENNRGDPRANTSQQPTTCRSLARRPSRLVTV